MIRLYFDQSFEVGDRIRLSAEELRYFRSVRRGQGEVCVFNRSGQEAYGQMGASEFKIEKVTDIPNLVYPVSVGVARPEAKILPLIVRSLSELGVQNLFIFDADRSQKAKKIESQDRYDKLVIEACRQCRRASPMVIEQVNLNEPSFLKKFDQILFMDEASQETTKSKSSSRSGERILSLIGPEGGWTERERDLARQRGFIFCHFKTPILRVETAAICGTFYVLEKYFGVAS